MRTGIAKIVGIYEREKERWGKQDPVVRRNFPLRDEVRGILVPAEEVKRLTDEGNARLSPTHTMNNQTEPELSDHTHAVARGQLFFCAVKYPYTDSERRWLLDEWGAPKMVLNSSQAQPEAIAAMKEDVSELAAVEITGFDNACEGHRLNVRCIAENPRCPLRV